MSLVKLVWAGMLAASFVTAFICSALQIWIGIEDELGKGRKGKTDDSV